MKTITTLIPLLLLCSFNFGQENPNEYNFGNYTYTEEKSSIHPEIANKIKSHKIAKEIFITTDKKGKTSFSSQLTYNKNGQITQMIKQRWRGNSDNVIEYTYDENNLLINRKLSNTKKVAIFEERHFTYNEKSLINSFEIKGKNGTKRRTTFEYLGSEVSSRNYFKKDQTSPSNNWAYSYNEDGSRESTKHFKNGKLKYIWNYDCDPKGLLEKEKDNATVCINTSTNEDGSYTWTKKETDEKNKIVITESNFSKDSICQKYVKKYMDGTLKSTYDLVGNVSTQTAYKKGKKYITHINISGENGYDSSYERIWHRNTKINFKQAYIYDKSGLLVERNNYDENGKLTSKSSVTRSFYD